MNPRKFFDIFQTKTGKFLVFAGVVEMAGILFYEIHRRQSPSASEPSPTLPSTPVQDHPVTINREGVPLILSNAPGTSTNSLKPSSKAPAPLPLTLYDGGSDSLDVSDTYAPYGRLIPCETIITIDSAKIETPIIGFVTEDLWHDGKLIIPAGAEVHGKAKADRSRERIASENWSDPRKLSHLP